MTVINSISDRAIDQLRRDHAALREQITQLRADYAHANIRIPQAPSDYIAKTPAGGIAGLTGTTPGTATCTLYKIDESTGKLSSLGDTETVYNLGTKKIAGDSYTPIHLSGILWVVGSPPDVDLWKTINADFDTVDANSPTDTLGILGGTGISTAIAGDNLTITNDSANVDQNLWLNVTGDTGTTAANTIGDTITVAGGEGIVTAVSGDTLTITGGGSTVEGAVYTKKITVEHTDLQAASMTPTVTIKTLVAKELIIDAFIDIDTIIPAGDGFTQYDIKLNYAADTVIYVDFTNALALGQKGNPTPGFDIGLGSGNWVEGTADIDIDVLADQNTNNSSAGTFLVYLLLVRLP